MFPIYPYINLTDLNLDYILKSIKEMNVKLDNFINVNTIKYADPIQWNITTQYQANTVVVDPNNGNAYISVQPVPAGVALTDTDYWTIIFTLDLISANNNITSRNDGTNANATFTSAVGDWLIWDNVLYRVTAPIAIGNAYIPGTNVTPFSVENFVKLVYDNMHILDSFPGATSCEKLFNALDTITNGVILAGDIVIDDVYTPQNKDYRNIAIHGATITLNVDNWYDATTAASKSVPKFNDCNIIGNGYTFYTSDTCIVGPEFDGCTINNMTLFNSTAIGNYVQSLRLHGSTLNDVETFINAEYVFDMKIIDSRIESAYGKLITLYGNDGSIRQGSVHNTCIEGRTGVVFEINSAFDFVIDRCYFESNANGLIKQTNNSGACYITVKDNWFVGTLDVTYAIEIASGAWQDLIIQNNVCNYAAGKLLTNVWYVPKTLLTPHNINYDHNWSDDSDGFNKPTRFSLLTWDTVNDNVEWNTNDSTWDIKIYIPTYDGFAALRPFYVYINASYDTLSQYTGYAVLRVCPRTYYNTNTGNIENICDVEIVDSCNKNTATKTSTVTATANVSTTDIWTTPNLTVKIGGFNNLRNAKVKIVDTFGIVDYLTRE